MRTATRVQANQPAWREPGQREAVRPSAGRVGHQRRTQAILSPDVVISMVVAYTRNVPERTIPLPEIFLLLYLPTYQF